MKAKLLRRIFLLLFPILSLASQAKAQGPNTINTIAGGGVNPSSPTAAYLASPSSVAKDSLGNVYIATPSLEVVYKVTPGGQLSICAGTGIAGFSGDGGPANAAELDYPSSIGLDSAGDLFIADYYNNRIRRVDANTGVITTYAGSGNQYNGVGFFGGYSGDGGPATSALLSNPNAVTFDNNGNLFIADAGNNVVRMVDNSAHNITTYAGNGTPGTAGTTNGDGGPAKAAELDLKFSGGGAGAEGGLATDANGNLYVADTGDDVVRVVDTSANHIITTYAGSPSHLFTYSGDGGPATSAGMNQPVGLSINSSGDLFIADYGSLRIRMVDTTASHIITTVVGSGSECTSYTTGCGDGGVPTSASLDFATSIFVDSSGDLFIADYGTTRVRVVSSGASPIITTFAGGGSDGQGGPATSALLAQAYLVASDASGNLFVTNNFGVNRVDGSTQTITQYAGNGLERLLGEFGGAINSGPAAQTAIDPDLGLALDSSGDLFVGELWDVGRVDAVTKNIATYAGTGLQCTPVTPPPACGDGGPATSATFSLVSGLATDSQGNLYVSDFLLGRIRRVDVTTGIISNYAGTGVAGYSGDGGPATSATLSFPYGLAFDSQDNLYVADAGNNVIRKIDNTSAHNITTYAFNGLPTFGGDGGTALSASMQFPYQVALDANGNLFVGGGVDNVIRRIDATDQSVITVAGDVNNLDGGFSGDGGPSTQAMLSNYGVAVDGKENLYIADVGNNRVRSVHLAPVAVVNSTLLQPFGTILPNQTSASEEVTITNAGLDDLAITNITAPANFVVTNECTNPDAEISSVSPGTGTCILMMTFVAPAGATGGTVFSGNLTFSTNDPANPSFSLPVTATIGAAPGVTLTVTEAGTGTVISSPSGIECSSATCTANFALNQQVTLTAIGNTGFVLTGWTVNGVATTCPGTLTCTVTMSQAQNVTATFGSASLTVAALGNGSGTVTSTPAGINCTVTSGVTSGTCTFSGFPSGTQTVTLTATSTGGSTFAGWLGICNAAGITGTGTGPCQFPLVVASDVALSGAQATAVFSGPAQSFSQGQIFVGSVDGMIFVYNPNGTLAQVLNSGNLGGTIAGMNFDKTGNLYAANPTTSSVTGGTVEFFGNNGSGPTTFGTGYNSEPIGVLIDPSGNVFVGQAAGQMSLLEFAGAQNAAPSSTFYPAFESAGVAYLDLLDDNASIIYTSASPSVKNFDIVHSHQNPDLATNLPGGSAYALRELGDKSILVANTSEIVRLSPAGAVLQTYSPVAGALFYALNLDPDGVSFWAGDASSGKVFHIRISDGTILSTINTGLGFSSTSLAFSTIFGIAVFGQPQAGGADVSVAMNSSPASVPINGQVSYSIAVTNNGPISAANVAMTDAFPAGVKFVSSATSLGSCTGTTTVTCTLGTMTSGQSATMTIVVDLNQAGTVLNTANVTSTTPDPNTANNSSSSSTVVTVGNVLTVAELGPGLGSVSSTPAGISCQPNCSARFLAGTVVTLSAAPGTGSAFTGWSGACSGTGNCVVTMSAAQSVVANFTLTGSTACNAVGATIWTGATSNNWSTPSNWSPQVVPNSPTVTACISDGHGAAAVILDISAAVGTVVIDSGSTLTIGNNLDLQVFGSIYNAGQITIAANGNATFLSMSGAVTLTGEGSVVLSIGTGGNTAFIRQDTAGSTLTNVNNTISGRGQIGAGGGTALSGFINQVGGTVDANSSGNTLLINSAGVANQGVLDATGGGILETNVTVNNAGGKIIGGSGSQVQFLSGTTIQGGLLSGGTGTGAFFGTAVSSTAVLDGTTQGPLTNTATYTDSNNADTELLGTINNTGSFLVTANGNATFLSMSGAVTLTGSGAVVMSIGTGGNTPFIRQDASNSTLTNVNNTISGVGQIGAGGGTSLSSFVNEGVVNATGNALLINASAVRNQNLLQATTNSTLQIDTLVNNAGGNITANGTGSQVQFLSGTRIEGGTLNTLNSPSFFGTAASNSVVLDGTTQGPLNNAATYTDSNNSDTELLGTINNTGSFLVTANGNATFLSTSGPVTLTGGGTVVLSIGTGGNTAFIRQDASNSTLTNVNNAISGRGQIGAGGSVALSGFINQAAGTVNANSSGNTLLINSSGVVNQGLFEATGGGILETNVTVNNAGGTITAASSSQVQFLSGTTIQGGLLSGGTGTGGFFGTAVSNGAVLDGTTQGPLTNAATYTDSNNADTELLGTINNTGSFLVTANGNATFLSMSGAVTLTGSGAVVMSIGTGGNTPFIRQDASNSTLTNVNNTISGVGQIGAGGGTSLSSFVNEGVVNATGNALLINASAVRNQNLLQATTNSTLQIDTLVNNAGGNITANGTGSQVQFLSGTRIEGGTLNTLNSPSFFGTAASNSVVLDGTTQGPLNNAATYTDSNNSDTELLGTINNTGSFLVTANGNATFLSTSGPVTLTGGGTVVLSIGTGGNTAFIRQDASNSTLTNVNNAISGRGQIGAGGSVALSGFINQAAGTVNANSSGNTLLINSSGVVNQGLFEATGGGILETNVTVNNAGGTITAASSSQVQFLSGTTIQGGLLSGGTGTGGFFGTAVSNGAVLDGTTQGPLTNAATYTDSNNADTELLGTINNTGSFLVTANGNATFLSMSGAVTLTGSGAVVMSIGTGGNTAFIRQDTSGSSLTNSGNTITGPGQLTVPTFMQSAGFIQIPSGVSDSITSFSVSGGNAQIDGSLSVSGGVATSGTGVVSGIGSIPASVSNAGITEAGDIPAAGTLTISSAHTFTQTSAGSYEVALGGTTPGSGYSQLNVSGTATLAGALNIRFVNEFTPTVGTQFTILKASAISGTFSTINAPAVSGITWGVMYNTTSVVLIAGGGSPTSFTLTVTEPGNGSGTVTDDLGQISCVDTAGVVTGACSANYQSGTVVTLTAAPAAGATFNGWNTCPLAATCSVTMTSSQAEQVTFGTVVPTFSISVNELGTGTGLVTDNLAEINCGEIDGIGSGTCAASYPNGTQVALTINVTSPSTFGGWGGACSDFGTNATCNVSVTSALNVTANFVPPPVSIPLTFSPGTNVVQQAPFDCPSNPDPTPANPCMDPNAHALQLQIPTVSTGFTVTVTATEVPPTQADGLCEVGNTVLNDFDCRFVTFFSNGTDANGNTIVPLCYPYANGNCVHYDVYSGTPGTEPDPSFYSGGVDWTIKWNNGTFMPPALYAGTTPQLYDDPDYAPTPTSAVGTVCSQPMTINGVGQSYECQFEFNITTFFESSGLVDPGIGGHTKQLNDVVVAFPPNSAGALSVSSTPDAPTTNAGGPIGFTIAVSNAGPGTENTVALSDPLPAGTGVNWNISPAYSGPGTCSIVGLAGSQVLSCSFGSLASGASASVHVSSASSSAGTYTNAATATATNEQILGIGTITVQPAAPAFTGLTASQAILFGTASVTLSGAISAAGPVYPASEEIVSVTINGTTLPATIGTNGTFSVVFPTATIPASATPYVITYSYAGDTNLTAASDTSTALTVNAAVVSETLSVTTMGTGKGMVTDGQSEISCSTAGGKQSGTCSANYASGTPVTLTAAPTAPSTFGGWGGACASFGMATSCTVTMNSPLAVTADFVPPPASQNLTFPVGTNPPPQQAVFNCPSNPNPTPGNPCMDPNAHTLQLSIPQVIGGFTVTVTATEVPPSQADGLCEVGNTVLNDFDCRFVTFFSNGTDANGNTIVPLCYPYANGNCVHYDVYSGTPGTEPDPTLYSGGVAWTIAWNNGTFVPPALYAGTTPQLYDDPDYAPTPTSAVGTVCSQPMTINGVGQSYECQFEFNITTFFESTGLVDPGIGGHTKQLNDVVVAFPPSTAGQLSVSSTPDAATANAGTPIGITFNVSNAGPGTENNVALNDPLPAGVTWTISPAYSGPGTCTIAGAAGSQVLNCSFGNLASGSSAMLHVSGASATAGTYVNAATVTVNNQQFLTITTITVQLLTPAFSGLTASQAITLGTASVGLSGTISAAGPAYPASGETVSVAINGTTAHATIGASGQFSLVFPTATIPASSTPYSITYSYAGDANLSATSDSSTMLTVNSIPPTITIQLAPTSPVVLSQNGSVYNVALTITNVGNATASSIVVTGATLGSTSAPSFPAGNSVTSLAAGGTATIQMVFSSSAGAVGASVPLKVSGTYAGGPLSGNWSATVRSVKLP